MMKVFAYVLCYNEAQILPFAMRNLLSFADKVTVYDNMSTDSSREIAAAHGAEVVTFDTDGWIDNFAYTDIREHCWKKDRAAADWVVVCDMDEFLYSAEGVRETLATLRESGTTLPSTNGFRMVSGALPPDDGSLQLYSVAKRGNYAPNFSKPSVFDPKRIREIGYSSGAHYCNPIGDVVTGVEPEPMQGDSPRYTILMKERLDRCALSILHYNSFGWEYHKRRLTKLSAKPYRGSDKNPYAESLASVTEADFSKHNDPERYPIIL